MRGKLIVFEGIDGSGTETQSKLLLKHMLSKGIKAERIEYPDYEGDLGKLIRLFLDRKHELSAEMQFLLYAGDMVKDREKINAWLNKGRNVICDRYFLSTIVYQGIRGFRRDKALRFAKDFGVPKPDIVFFLNITPDESAKRKMDESGKLDRNEADLAFLGRVNASYEEMSRSNVFGQWFVLDGEKPKEEIAREVLNVLEKTS
ncbi:MAG: dTMP kinase [Candidatus Aenigmatarchaeota archaeon]|nr:MAG: dTMP kinase [Candidatus Aenigmarchaeota archaeon]